MLSAVTTFVLPFLIHCVSNCTFSSRSVQSFQDFAFIAISRLDIRLFHSKSILLLKSFFLSYSHASTLPKAPILSLLASSLWLLCRTLEGFSSPILEFLPQHMNNGTPGHIGRVQLFLGKAKPRQKFRHRREGLEEVGLI